MFAVTTTGRAIVSPEGFQGVYLLRHRRAAPMKKYGKCVQQKCLETAPLFQVPIRQLVQRSHAIPMLAAPNRVQMYAPVRPGIIPKMLK